MRWHGLQASGCAVCTPHGGCERTAQANVPLPSGPRSAASLRHIGRTCTSASCSSSCRWRRSTCWLAAANCCCCCCCTCCQRGRGPSSSDGGRRCCCCCCRSRGGPGCWRDKGGCGAALRCGGGGSAADVPCCRCASSTSTACSHCCHSCCRCASRARRATCARRARVSRGGGCWQGGGATHSAAHSHLLPLAQRRPELRPGLGAAGEAAACVAGCACRWCHV